MSVAAEIDEINGGTAGEATKRQLRLRAKARAWRDLLAAIEEGTFTRGDYSVEITDADLVRGPHIGRDGTNPEALLVKDGWAIVIRMRCTKAGKVFRRPAEPWVIFNPPSRVEDGTKPNPDYDPNDPASPETVPAYREDIRAALRTALIDFLRDRYRG